MNVKIAQIRDTQQDNLSISWDEEDGFVLLFTPDMNNTSKHYHIDLQDYEIVRLQDFCSTCQDL